ncbi:DUF2799 domain-containing protein [Amaricoccus sp.]|uniref:DUF2799 domain-containing protein n=1 Tax=Amaricoccus sp. TaxID=1872485 RepID=UPI001B6FF089|nr:DUF2799 domain-containing protein [Amaricoccus sp.]MBP7002432.1 DUF2799 domain-containing protein [Amaricoccus sp.]
MKALTPLGFLLALGSCATLSEEACRGGDWRGVGYRDGAAGRAEGFLSNHAEACAEYGIAPDVAAWRAGRAEGLRSYCTPANAFEAGLRGGRLNPVCPPAERWRLAAAEERGLRIHGVEVQIDGLERENREARERIDKLLKGEVGPEERRRIRRLERGIEDREQEIRRLEREARHASIGY